MTFRFKFKRIARFLSKTVSYYCVFIIIEDFFSKTKGGFEKVFSTNIQTLSVVRPFTYSVFKVNLNKTHTHTHTHVYKKQ